MLGMHYPGMGIKSVIAITLWAIVFLREGERFRSKKQMNYSRLRRMSAFFNGAWLKR
jgi:hypothetical protein